jgi:phosphoglycerol transferase MdoB-like AlkP superfamily enzyme
VDRLHRQPGWERTLVVAVPDHQGCYPEVMDNYALTHYQVPLVMTGGIVRAPRRIDTLGSQTDLVATLLSLVGASHGDFPWSKDMLDDGAAHYAVFAVPDAVGMVREEGALIWDNTSARVMLSTWSEKQQEGALQTLKAYYQKLYKTADRL